MFGGKRCDSVPQVLGAPVTLPDQNAEQRLIGAAKCPSGAKLRYSRSRPPRIPRMVELAFTREQLWLHDHVLVCERCGAETVIECSRQAAGLPAPSGVAVRSKARIDRYLLQHKLLPYAIFSNPSDAIRRMVVSGPGFASSLLRIAQQDQQLPNDGIVPVKRTMELPQNFGRLGVAIEFEDPRAPGEAYFAVAVLANANEAPQYFVCERSISDGDGPIGRSAMFCAWTCSPSGETERHLNFGEMPAAEFADFLIAVGGKLSH